MSLYRMMIGLIFLVPAAASGHTVDDLAACTTIGDDVRRLQCYDASARRPADLPQAGYGRWLVSDETNPIDDSREFTAVMVSGEGELDPRGPLLIIRCTGNKTDLLVNWRTEVVNPYGSSDIYSKALTHRIDKRKAEAELWSLSVDNDSTFFPHPIDLLRQLAEATTFAVQVQPYDRQAIAAVFSLSGIRRVVAAIAESCHWTLDSPTG